MKSKLMQLFKRAAPEVSRAAPGASVPGLGERIEQARALHLRGEHEAAAELYKNLLEAHPDSADAHYRYGNLLKDRGALDRASAEYERAIEIKPDYAHAYCNRAVVLGLLNRPSEALSSYDRAIEFDPADAIAHCNRALLLIGLNQKDAAMTGFDAAIKSDPNSFTAHFGRGALLLERKRWADSLAAYDRAIAINSNNAMAHYNRATVLEGLNRHAEAVRSFDRAIELNAHDATFYSHRGVLQQILGRFASALADYDHAVALSPDYPEVWFNRGTVLKELDDLNGALVSYDKAIAARPGYDVPYVNRGTALQGLGRVREAIASYRQAINFSPDLPEAHHNLALASLAVGDYAAGWAEYEWRWRAKGGPIYREKRKFSEPLWLGADSIEGKTILLYGEQGLGDSLQFCRYVELVAKLGPRVILEVPPPLVNLLGSLPGAAQIIGYGQQLPHFDFQCPLMSLPLAFKTALETIPSNAGYLKSDPSKVAEWQLRLGLKTKLRIGLTWSGNQAPGTNPKRNIALSNLVPYLSDDIDYYCMQTEVTATDQEALARTPKIRNFNSLLRDFTDTAALCMCMDMLISVDTSVAHLAGALGKETWVLLPFAPDWRWLTDRDDSPWYASIRLFRQLSDRGWRSVFERVEAELRLKRIRFETSHSI